MSQRSQEGAPGLSGLLTRDLPNGETYWYNNTYLRAPLVLLDGSYSISLYNVTCADSGLYTCHLSAPVGEQNREGGVVLRLTGEEMKHLHILHLLMYVKANICLFSDCLESQTATFDAFWAVFPVFALVFAFLAFGISYVSD